jgi:hypothetical protein
MLRLGFIGLYVSRPGRSVDRASFSGRVRREVVSWQANDATLSIDALRAGYFVLRTNSTHPGTTRNCRESRPTSCSSPIASLHVLFASSGEGFASSYELPGCIRTVTADSRLGVGTARSLSKVTDRWARIFGLPRCGTPNGACRKNESRMGSKNEDAAPRGFP